MPACPPPNPLWLQAIVTGAPALLIGLLAWLVNRGQLNVSQAQLNVAQEKLRQDLFDRRFAVFYAFQTLLLAVAMSKPNEEVEPLREETVAKLATARFLFEPDVAQYLQATFEAAMAISSLRSVMNDPEAWPKPPTPTDREVKLKYQSDRFALFDKINEVAAKLAPALRLRDLGSR